MQLSRILKRVMHMSLNHVTVGHYAILKRTCPYGTNSESQDEKYAQISRNGPLLTNTFSHPEIIYASGWHIVLTIAGRHVTLAGVVAVPRNQLVTK